MNGSSIIAAVLAQQAVWSRTASRLKTAMGRAPVDPRARRCDCYPGDAWRAACSASGADSTAARILAAAGAVFMALATFLQRHTRANRNVSRWIRARSASEGLKEEVFRYLTRTGAYDASDPEGVLRDKVRSLLDNVTDPK